MNENSKLSCMFKESRGWCEAAAGALLNGLTKAARKEFSE